MLLFSRSQRRKIFFIFLITTSCLFFGFRWDIPALLLVPLIIAASSIWRGPAYRQQLPQLEQQALKRRGQVYPGAGFLCPELSLSHNGLQLQLALPRNFLEQEPEEEPPYRTQISLSIPGRRGDRFKIFPENTLELHRKNAFGLQDIETGNSALDDAYVFKASNRHYLRSLLNGEIQELLLSLRSLEPEIVARPGKLRITIPALLTSSKEYDLLIETALAVGERIAGGLAGKRMCEASALALTPRPAD